ncbi:glycosyltransferase family 2 protein [Chloroflexota bacterium]
MPVVPKISVVVPTYNRAAALDLTLHHLEGQSLDGDQFEVLVVDDGSTDGTRDAIAAGGFSFRLAYHRQENRGAAAARNLGAEQARADLLLCLDSDVIPDARLLETHVHSHAAPSGHLVVGRVRTWPEANTAWYEKAIQPERAGMDYGPESRTIPFYMTLGGNFSIAICAFQEIGGYDQSFPAAGCEETEFAYRASLLGYAVQYQPAAIGYHNHPRSVGQRCRQQAAHMSSMALLLAKHPELQTVIPGVDELMPLWAAPRSAGAVLRRSRAWIYGCPCLRAGLYQGLLALDRLQIAPRLAKMLFWRLMRGWRHAGFRRGLRRYGAWPTRIGREP